MYPPFNIYAGYGVDVFFAAFALPLPKKYYLITLCVIYVKYSLKGPSSYCHISHLVFYHPGVLKIEGFTHGL